MLNNKLLLMKNELEQELKNNILPFWCEKVVDEQNDGFYGVVMGDLTPLHHSDKACILNSRILWALSSAYNYYKDPIYLTCATRAFLYLSTYFWDSEFDGLIWLVDYKGRMKNTRKQLYNMTYAIYGLVAYYKASDNLESLNVAIKLFQIIEEHFLDQEQGGYFDAFHQDWTKMDKMQINPFETNAPKTFNSHLHVMESYSVLYEVWKDDRIKKALENSIVLIIDKFFDAKGKKFELFYDANWKRIEDYYNFGLEIEGSWLLTRAVTILGDETLITRSKIPTLSVAQMVYEHGIDRDDGAVISPCGDLGVLTKCKEGWSQTEGLIGFFNLYEITGEERYLNATMDIWAYIKNYIVDKKNGEWHSKITSKGISRRRFLKSSMWKCPYHNVRGCLEIIERINNKIKSDR